MSKLQHQTLNILVGKHTGTSNNMFMEILLFHCQQIPSRVNGMQNTHHWSVMLSRAAMRLLTRTGGGKIK